MRTIYPRMGLVALSLFLLAATSGCGELRGRRRIREGNALYKDVRYSEAVAAYESAVQYLPEFPTLWMNKGIACRQLLLPGSKTPENDAAAKCALEAFQKLRQLRPDDERSDQLYIQTLLDAERYDTLASYYLERVKKDPSNLQYVNGLVQVYSKWNHFDDALTWYRRKADLQADDAESQYAVGVFVWQRLFQRGGGVEKALYDPRPDPNKTAKQREKEAKSAPECSADDICGEKRIELSDIAIGYLEKAIAIRPKYGDAMVYMNLVLRQKSFSYFNEPDKWEAIVKDAVKWQERFKELQPPTPGAAGSAEPASSSSAPPAASSAPTRPAPKRKH